MRIAQVSHNLECGGSMAMVVFLSAKLTEMGHEIDVVCTDRATGSAHEQLWLSWLDKRGVSCRFLGRRRGDPGFTTAAKLWRLVQRENYDVVHSHLPMPDAMTGVARRLVNNRFVHVLTVHNTQEPRSRVLAACASGADVVYCSEAARRRNPVSGLSSTVIPNGIVQSLYGAPRGTHETRWHLGLPNDAIVVIAVGRMCEQKNFDAAIDAIAMFKQRVADRDVRFLFCGDGQEKDRLEERSRKLGLAGIVQFLGNRTDIPALLSASNVFLSTSIYEGMPLTVLEALSAGLPCILSSIDEHYEIARAMPGCVFAPSNSPDAIASALDAVTSDPISAHVLRRARSPFLEKFSIDNCAASYLRLYELLVQPRLSPATTVT
jgi:glycosyltransferase involved in cell wall biosynthesis